MGHGDSYGSQCSCGVGTGSGGVHCKGVAGRAPLRDRACATTPAGRQGQDKGKENYEYGSRPGRPFSSCACKHPHRPDREQGRQCQRTHFHFARRMRRSRKCGCHRYVRRLGIVFRRLKHRWRKTATQLRRACTTQRHGSRKSGRCAHCGTQRPTGTGSHSERGCTQRATVISNIEGERRNVAQ